MESGAGVDGYTLYFSCAEWWQYKTRFTQWFTKHYVASCLPFGMELQVSPGHVPPSVSVHYFCFVSRKYFKMFVVQKDVITRPSLSHPKVQFIHLETEVLRRNLYKGTHSTSPHSLPVDAATAMGILLVLGTILPANSLSAEGVQASRSLLSTLEEHSKLHEISCVFPSGREMVVESNKDGYFSIENLKPIIKKLDIPFARQLEKEVVVVSFVIHPKGSQKG